MASGAGTFNSLGSAVNDLFSADSHRTKAAVASFFDISLPSAPTDYSASSSVGAVDGLGSLY